MAYKKALVVDDSMSARFALKKLLQKLELSTELAGSAQEALDFLNSEQPDVIFMDHMLPGMNGLLAVETIKKNPNWSNIPIIMCTSNEGPAYEKEALARGAVATLAKPANPKDLTQALNQLNLLNDTSLSLADIKAEATNSASKTTETNRAANTAALGSGLSRETLEKIARDVASGVASTKVSDLLEKRLPSLKRELNLKMTEHLESQLLQLGKNLHTEAQTWIQEKIAQELEKLASMLLQKTIHELQVTFLQSWQSRIENELAQHTATVKKELGKPLVLPESMILEIQEQAKAAAGEKAMESADQIMKSISSSFHVMTDEKATKASERTLRRFIEEVNPTLKKQKLLTWVSMGIAAFAVILAFVLK